MLGRVPVAVVWNPSAGAVKNAAAARDFLESVDDVQWIEHGDRDAAVLAAIDASRSGARLVVAAGGDGTVRSVLEAISQTPGPSVIGILPLGTGNDHARALGLPLDPEEALGVLRSGNVRYVDGVRFASSDGDGWYANMLTGGNTGRVLQQITDEWKQRWGAFSYIRGVFELMRDLETYRIRVGMDGGAPESMTVTNVFLANGPSSGGGLMVSPDAVLDDGLVDLVAILEGGSSDLARLVAEYAISDFLDHELIEFRRARQVWIESDPPMPLTADGDVIGTTSLSVDVAARRFAALVPAKSA